MLNFPENVIPLSFRREDFRVAMGRPFWPVCIGALLASEALQILPGTASLHVLVFVVPIAVIVLCALILMLMAMLYRVEVGPEGIHCYDVWSRPRHASWSTITRARMVRLFGLDYLVIHSQDRRRPLWIPMFVSRDHLFRDMLITYTDATHGLQQKLEQAA